MTEFQIVEDTSDQLLFGIEKCIKQTGRNVIVYLNTEISRLYWSIGNYIVAEIQYETYSQHGQQILATLPQKLTETFEKGYVYSALTRMIKIAPDIQWRRYCLKSIGYKSFRFMRICIL